MDNIRNSSTADEAGETSTDSDAHNQRVVAFAPTPQDARLCQQILVENNIEVCCCDTIQSFAETITEGAGIALIAQEHLSDTAIAFLRQSLAKQPKWSEVPILVLLQTVEPDTPTLQRILTLEHVTLINRPLRIAIFINTVQAKLRDRLRQLEVRDLLAEQRRTQISLRREARRLDMAIQAGGMAAWEWSSTEVFWSDAFRRLHGFAKSVSPSEAAMFAAIVDEDRDRIVAQWSDAIAHSEPFRSEFRINHPRLGERWIAAVGEPVKSKSGKTLRYAGLQWDVTDSKRSDDLLRQSEKYFREIADASPAMLWMTDENHLCTFLSKSWYETTGQTETEGMGIGWTYATHPDDQQRAADEFLAAANAHLPFLTEYRLRMADGSYRWAVDVGRPRNDADGTFLGYTGYVIDVNDRKEFEESLKHAKELAENANRSRGEFLANMSHEIRTPMAAILGHADILKDHLKDPDNIQVVETIRRNGGFLLNIINDILDLSKIDSGKMQIEWKSVRPDGLLAEVRSLMDVRASEKQIPLKIEFAGPIPELVETDAVRLRQILLNLVGNAIKFTNSGEVKIVVDFVSNPDAGKENSGEPHYGKLSFQIIDTGIGIKPEDQNALFQPFVQADNTSTRSFGGTGLGLAICRRLANALGGDVALQSEFGKGSKFTLTIETKASGPLVEPNLSLDISADLPDEDVALTATVLVVDDRRDIRYLAQHFIEKAGGTVVTATNGLEAVNFIADNNSPKVDIIVMDMQMPVMDGYEASSELRRRGCKLPIIALTANAMKSDRDQCLAAGCTDYTTKPLDSKKLVAMIGRLSTVERPAL